MEYWKKSLVIETLIKLDSLNKACGLAKSLSTKLELVRTYSNYLTWVSF